MRVARVPLAADEVEAREARVDVDPGHSQGMVVKPQGRGLHGVNVGVVGVHEGGPRILLVGRPPGVRVAVVGRRGLGAVQVHRYGHRPEVGLAAGVGGVGGADDIDAAGHRGVPQRVRPVQGLVHGEIFLEHQIVLTFRGRQLVVVEDLSQASRIALGIALGDHGGAGVGRGGVGVADRAVLLRAEAPDVGAGEGGGVGKGAGHHLLLEFALSDGELVGPVDPRRTGNLVDILAVGVGDIQPRKGGLGDELAGRRRQGEEGRQKQDTEFESPFSFNHFLPP